MDALAPTADRFCDGGSQWLGGPLTAGFCEARDQVAGAVDAAGDQILGQLAASISDGVATVFSAVTSFWIDLPTPGVTAQTCTPIAGSGAGQNCTLGPNDTLAFLWDRLSWLWGALLVASVIVAAGKMAWTRRKEPFLDLVRSLSTFVVASTAGVAATGLAIEAGDEFSSWVVDEASGGNLGEGLLSSASLGGLGAGLVVVLGILAIILGGIQLILMIFRLAVLTLMMTFLPLAAAATNTDWGRNWFRKLVGWLAAFVLYKPVAALVYAAAFKLLSHGTFGTDALLSFTAGIAMMCLAILALPAIMKAIVPAVAAMPGGGASVAGVMAVGATGAAMVATGGTSAIASGTAGTSSGATAATGAASGAGLASSGGASTASSTSSGSPGVAAGQEPSSSGASSSRSKSGVVEPALKGGGAAARWVENTVDPPAEADGPTGAGNR